MGFVKAMDGLSFIVKLILALPVLDIVWAIYRIVKGACKGHVLTLIFGILWIFPGSAICWIIDLVSVILFKKPVVFTE